MMGLQGKRTTVHAHACAWEARVTPTCVDTRGYATHSHTRMKLKGNTVSATLYNSSELAVFGCVCEHMPVTCCACWTSVVCVCTLAGTCTAHCARWPTVSENAACEHTLRTLGQHV